MTRFTSRAAGMLAAVFVMSLMLSAQPQRMTPQEQTDRLAKELKLSDEQKAKVLDLFTARQEKMKKVFDESQGDRESMRPQMQKIRQETDDQMKKVLTEDQYNTWIKQRNDFQGGRRGQNRDRTAPPDSAKK